jgi:hypothetical protein
MLSWANVQIPTVPRSVSKDDGQLDMDASLDTASRGADEPAN